MLPLLQVNDADFNPLPRKEGDVNWEVDKEIKFDFNPLPRKEGDFRLLQV